MPERCDPHQLQPCGHSSPQLPYLAHTRKKPGNIAGLVIQSCSFLGELYPSIWKQWKIEKFWKETIAQIFCQISTNKRLYRYIQQTLTLRQINYWWPSQNMSEARVTVQSERANKSNRAEAGSQRKTRVADSEMLADWNGWNAMTRKHHRQWQMGNVSGLIRERCGLMREWGTGVQGGEGVGNRWRMATSGNFHKNAEASGKRGSEAGRGRTAWCTCIYTIL